MKQLLKMAREPIGLLEQVHWSAGKSKKYHYEYDIALIWGFPAGNPFWQLYHQI